MNVEIRSLEQTIVKVLNASRLPTEVKRLVVADVLRKLEVQAESDILAEMQKKEGEQHEQSVQEN